MQGSCNFAELSQDVDNLLRVIMFGDHKIDCFTKELAVLNGCLQQLASGAAISRLDAKVYRLSGSLRSTDQTLCDWRKKAQDYLKLAHQEQVLAKEELTNFEKKVQGLVALIKKQQQQIKKQGKQAQTLCKAIRGVRRKLVARVVRGREPILV